MIAESDEAEPQQPRVRERWAFLVTETWFPELASWVFSFTSLVAIVVILRVYDGQALPHFPYGITLGTLVALFTTCSTTAMMAPISQAISQLKWLRFGNRDRKAHDLEIFDKASRGVWGSFVLIIRLRARGLPCIGALLTILVLGGNTITQQSINFVSQQVFNPEGVALVPRSYFYDSWKDTSSSTNPSAYNVEYTISPPKPVGQMQVAILSGLLGGNGDTGFAEPFCSTGNCTWDVYDTLSVCSLVSDISSSIVVKNHLNTPATTFTISPGLTITSWSNYTRFLVDVRSTGQYENSDKSYRDRSPRFPDDIIPELRFEHPFYGRNIRSKVFGSLKNSTVADFFVILITPKSPGTQQLVARAMEVNLHFCVQRLQTKVVNGRSQTKQIGIPITDFIHSESALPLHGRDPWVEPNPSMTAEVPDSPGKFKFSRHAQRAMLHYTCSQLNGTFWRDSGGGEDFYTSLGLEPIVKTLDRFVDDPVAGMRLFADTLATSISNSIRLHSGTNGTAVVGIAFHDKTHIQISWGWITLLAVLVAGSLAFLLTVLSINQKHACPLWRTSSIALLQALDINARPLEMLGIGSNILMESCTNDVAIQLRKDGCIWKLECTSIIKRPIKTITAT